MNERTVERQILVFWIIHWAFMSAVVVYVGVAEVMLFPMERTTGAPNSVVTLTLALVGLLSLPVGFFVPRVLVSDASLAAAETPGAYVARAIWRLILSDCIIESAAAIATGGAAIGIQRPIFYGLVAGSLMFLAGNSLQLRAWADEMRNRARREK